MKTMKSRWFCNVAATIAAVGLLTACSGPTGEGPTGDESGEDDTTAAEPAPEEACENPVTLTLAMGHEAPYPGEEAVLYAVPKQLGLFDEFCIDVTYQPTAGSGVAIQLVEAGGADLGQGNPSAVMAGIDQGVNVLSVYNIIPEYGSGLAVVPGGAISSPADLEGKIIGVSSLSSSRAMDAQAMVRMAGFDPEKDVEFVAVGAGAQAATALLEGKVDGLYLWDSAYFSIMESGMEIEVIKDVFPGVDQLLDYVQYASTSAIEEKGEAIGLLGRAGSMGQVWAKNNPEDALEMFYAEFPNAKPSSDEDRAADLALLKFTIDQFDPEGTAQSGWGEIPDEMTAATAEFFVEAGLFDEALPVEKYSTNQFVDSYNDFTADDVAALTWVK